MLEDTYSWVLHGGLAMVSGGGDLRSEGLSEIFFCLFTCANELPTSPSSGSV
jgi:hypothetical protein